MKNTANNSNDSNSGGLPNKKERHIVSWSQEEDDILREQIRIHGTENWTIIASKFKDKTTRQCRRRWFSYLNSDFKKGGWSPEEDMLLCEAQRLFGNRWTEIAKVVSGRTDNAVKNRFTTLCKKRAKRESALAKESVIFSESVPPLKKIRTCTSNQEEKIPVVDLIRRNPFAVVAHNVQETTTAANKSENAKTQEGTFLNKDDPKVIVLMQQAELLNSLAMKLNSEKTEQSLESAWMVIRNQMKQNKGSGSMEELSSCCEGSLPLWRESDMYEPSPSSSEYSTGSTVLAPCYRPEEAQAQISVMKQISITENQHEVKRSLAQESGVRISHKTRIPTQEDDVLLCEDMKENNVASHDFAHAEAQFNSPLQVTPMFRALAAAIPSPKFSESEKHFLMKTVLGMEESPSWTTTRTDPSRPPLCKRSLLHCL